jgi:hypothetical protein
VLRLIHFACMPSPIPRQVGWNLFARTIPFASAFPESEAGRLLRCRFRGLLSVYSRYGLHARRVAYATFYTEGFSSFVASAAASIATGWSEPVPGRDFSPAEDQRLFTAHSDDATNRVQITPVGPCNWDYFLAAFAAIRARNCFSF